MSWLRRLLLLAGLVTGAWLLGGTGEASADVRVEIDQLGVEVELPVADIGLKIETTPPRQPEVPVPPKPAPRAEPSEAAPVVPQIPAAQAPAQAEPPQRRHTAPEPPPSTTTRPTEPAPVPQQPQPQAEQPTAGTLPQSGAGAPAGSTQIPAGTLPHVMRPPTTTASLVSTEQQDVPHSVRAEEPTFSPD